MTGLPSRRVFPGNWRIKDIPRAAPDPKSKWNFFVRLTFQVGWHLSFLWQCPPIYGDPLTVLTQMCSLFFLRFTWSPTRSTVPRITRVDSCLPCGPWLPSQFPPCWSWSTSRETSSSTAAPSNHSRPTLHHGLGTSERRPIGMVTVWLYFWSC